MSTVLVVDDKEMMRDSVGATLQRAGFTVIAAVDGHAALDVITRRRPDGVVTDLRMPGMTGIELLERVREFDEDLPVVMMTAFGAVNTAVHAMRLGAYTYVTKPFEGDELVVAVKRAIEHARLRRENEILRRSSAAEDSSSPNDGAGSPHPRGLDRVIGDSAPMRDLKEQIRAVASSHGAVLVHGESGAGKEVVARAIHELSPRRGETFMAVNCAALSDSLLESELFGHEKGAFTGAERLRKGRFELSHRGTLLLDEISEMEPRLQAKLLRVLQERAFERVGSSATIEVDVRVVATTNRNLPEGVRKGDFRQDLYFRLNVLPLRVPALRERAEDVPALARHFVRAVCAREGRALMEIDDLALSFLMDYAWPGNVRELQNVCERAVVLAQGERIGADLIRPWLSSGASSTPVREDVPLVEVTTIAPGSNGGLGGASHEPEFTDAVPAPATLAPIVGAEVRPLEDIERQVIVETLVKFNGHRQRTASALGIGVRTLGLKLKRWKEEQLVSESL